MTADRELAAANLQLAEVKAGGVRTLQRLLSQRLAIMHKKRLGVIEANGFFVIAEGEKILPAVAQHIRPRETAMPWLIRSRWPRNPKPHRR